MWFEISQAGVKADNDYLSFYKEYAKDFKLCLSNIFFFSTLRPK